MSSVPEKPTGPQSGEYWPLNSAAQPSEHRPESSGCRSLLGQDAQGADGAKPRAQPRSPPRGSPASPPQLLLPGEGQGRGRPEPQVSKSGGSEVQEMRVLFQKHLLTSSSETLYTGLSGLHLLLTARLREMGTRVQGHPGG